MKDKEPNGDDLKMAGLIRQGWLQGMTDAAIIANEIELDTRKSIEYICPDSTTRIQREILRRRDA